MEQVDEKTRIYAEGEHIINKRVIINPIKNGYCNEIKCPEGYKLVNVAYIESNRYNCTFVNETVVECKEIEYTVLGSSEKYFGYYMPGKVVKEMNLRRKY